MTTLQAGLPGIRRISCGGKNSLRQKEIVRRSSIAVTVREVLNRLEARLYHAGVRYQFDAKSTWTGSVYLIVSPLSLFTPDGVRLRHQAAGIGTLRRVIFVVELCQAGD